jgi:hypothetical protein
MSFTDRLLRRAARRFKMEEAYDFVDASAHIGAKADVALPTDLLPMAARMFTRALFTQAAIQPNLDWVLPYWATRQFDKDDVSFLPRMSWVAMNLTHRNWTAVGLPGATREVVIDPRGLVTPWFEGWSLDTWVDCDGRTLFPSREKRAEQRHVENLPIVLTTLEAGDYRLELETFAAEIGKVECVLTRATVANQSERALQPTLYFSVRPFNPEGASLVKQIEAVAGDTLLINGALGLWFDRKPLRIVCANGRDGDCALSLRGEGNTPRAECAAGLATAFASFPLTLAPGASQTVVAGATTTPQPYTPKRASAVHGYDVLDRRGTTRAAWRRKLAEGFELVLPDQALADAFARCKTHLLLADDGDYITPGPMTYHHYWFRDSAYMVTALDRLGLHADAARKLADYPKRQRDDGFFLSQPGEWDAAGQGIWTLAEHARLTGDREFLIRMYEPIVKCAEWIVNTRKLATAAGPTKGMLPPGFSAEHFGPNDYYYWDDFWGAAGLRDAAWAAETLSLNAAAGRFERESEQFLADIRASLQTIEPRLGGPLMPTGPLRRFDCAAIGSVAALYPLRLLDPFDPLIENTLDALQERHFHEHGFFQQMIHSGINMYLTLHVAHCRVFRREARAWPMIRYVLAKATSAGTWPEAIHVKTDGGCMGDGMHLWAAADFLLILRDLLLFEEGDRLVLTPTPPLDWAEWGSRLEVRGAPTYFGEVSFRIEGFADEVALELDARWRNPPQRIEWNLPFTVETARVDGREVNVNDSRVIVPGGTSEVRVKRG